jgi:FtsH-binding integral membrane protein
MEVVVYIRERERERNPIVVHDKWTRNVAENMHVTCDFKNYLLFINTFISILNIVSIFLLLFIGRYFYKILNIVQ